MFPQSRKGKHLATWLAMWTLLLAACWPTLSQALVRTVGAPSELVQVCTTSGMVWVKVDASPDNSPTDTLSAAMGCSWCQLHAGVGLPPVGAPGLETPAWHSVAWPQAHYLSPHTNAPWRPAQSRAPPFIG